MKQLLLLTLALLIVGCQGKAASTPAPNAAKSELAKKLKTMTPEERKVYMRDHPDEVKRALPGL